jgi:hypothetical protein
MARFRDERCILFILLAGIWKRLTNQLETSTPRGLIRFLLDLLDLCTNRCEIILQPDDTVMSRE